MYVWKFAAIYWLKQRANIRIDQEVLLFSGFYLLEVFESSPRGGVADEPRRPLEVLGGSEAPGILHDSSRKLSREF